ncbi:MAG: hypothetical protein IT475_02020 [Aquimonas sp.]|nr:hypothetical protein [Xanthomonadales bacterium]MCC6504203.1 hypothetical protein [Aquimonas sp.]
MAASVFALTMDGEAGFGLAAPDVNGSDDFEPAVAVDALASLFIVAAVELILAGSDLLNLPSIDTLLADLLASADLGVTGGVL